MKTCLLLLFMLTGLSTQAQDHEYRFKVDQIESYPAAKSLISILRRQFNTEEQPTHISVVFDQPSQEFRIVSTTLLEQQEIQAVLSDYSYQMNDFKQIDPTSKSATHE